VSSFPCLPHLMLHMDCPQLVPPNFSNGSPKSRSTSVDAVLNLLRLGGSLTSRWHTDRHMLTILGDPRVHRAYWGLRCPLYDW